MGSPTAIPHPSWALSGVGGLGVVIRRGRGGGASCGGGVRETQLSPFSCSAILIERGLPRCNNPIVVRYATGNDSYLLIKQVSLFYPKVNGSTIYADITELACLYQVICRRILSRQIVIWVDCRAW